MQLRWFVNAIFPRSNMGKFFILSDGISRLRLMLESKVHST